MAQWSLANCVTVCKTLAMLSWSFHTSNWIRQICRESFLTGADQITFSSLLAACNSLLRKDKICTCTRSYGRDMEKLWLFRTTDTANEQSKFQPTRQRFLPEKIQNTWVLASLNILVSKSKIVLSLIVILFQPCVRAYIAELCIIYLFCPWMRNM